jgi:hypothetical protein
MALLWIWFMWPKSAQGGGIAALPPERQGVADHGVQVELKASERVEVEPRAVVEEAPVADAQVPDAALGPRVVLVRDGVTPVAGMTLVFVGVEEFQAASAAAGVVALAEHAAEGDEAEVAEQDDSVAREPWEVDWVRAALRRALRGDPMLLELEGLAFVGSTDGEGRVWLPEQALRGFERGYLIGASRSAYLPQRLVPIVAGQLPTADLLALDLAAVHVDVRFPAGWQPYPVAGVGSFLRGKSALTWSRRGKRVEALEDLYDGLFPEDHQLGVFGGRSRQLFAFVDGQASAASAVTGVDERPAASAAVTLPGFQPAAVEVPLVVTGRPIEAILDLVPLGLPPGELLIRLTPPTGIPSEGAGVPGFHLTMVEGTGAAAKVSHDVCALRDDGLRMAGIPPGTYRFSIRPMFGNFGREVELEAVEIRSGAQTVVQAPNRSFAWLVIDATAIRYRRDLPAVELLLRGRTPGTSWTRLLSSLDRNLDYEEDFAVPLLFPITPDLEWQALLDPPLFFDPVRGVSPAASGGSGSLPIELGIIPGGQVCTLKLAEIP